MNHKEIIDRLLSIYRATQAHTKPAAPAAPAAAFIHPDRVVIHTATCTGGEMQVTARIQVDNKRPTYGVGVAHKKMYRRLRAGVLYADDDTATTRTAAEAEMADFTTSNVVARLRVDSAMREKLRRVSAFTTKGSPAFAQWSTGVLVDLVAMRLVATDCSSLCTVAVDVVSWGTSADAQSLKRQFLLSAEIVRLMLDKSVGITSLTLFASVDDTWALAASDGVHVVEKLSRIQYPTYQRTIPRVDGRYEAFVKYPDVACKALAKYINERKDGWLASHLQFALSSDNKLLAYAHGNANNDPLFEFTDVTPVGAVTQTPRLLDGEGLDAKRMLQALKTTDRNVTVFIPVYYGRSWAGRWAPWLFSSTDYLVVVAPVRR